MASRPRAPGSAIAAEMGTQGIPSRGGSSPPPVSTKHEASGTAEAQRGPVHSPAPEGSSRPVEEKNSPEEIPWYDKLEDIDEDYRKYLSCMRFVNGHQIVVVPEGGLDAVPARVGDKSDGAGKKDAASRAISGKNGSGFGKNEKGKGKVAAIATAGPALKCPVGDSTTHPQKGQKEKNNGWKNGAKKIKVVEKEENPSAEPHLEKLNTAWAKGNVATITMGGTALMSSVCNSTTHHSVVEEEGKPSTKLPIEILNTVKRKRKSSNVQNAESRTASKGKEKVPAITTGESAPKSRVHDSTKHLQQGQKENNGGKNGAKMMKVVEEEGIPAKELHVETLNIVKRKRKSSGVQNAESHTASELHGVGVVWPTHIMEKPDSEFKEKLMCLLRKPFSQAVYNALLDKATTRPPATKIRKTRGGVKFYKSKHEREPSHFDRHPDLEKQVESTSKPNQVALLRGFFFWMKNILHQDQFRPWRDDFEQYKVTIIEID